ncbi:sodium:solute symporter family protein [Acidaminobacter sp. JC074]|uniref:sodium:solute symporter family protein n=1 Tax=Acidaminobacter sp. JC074 TaxID=2530199 RepID=UPI001F0D06B3|nr:sodium:solute symporter family protein [Acidaminobacter sp. JC074]MCH4887890.1 sodium:solute symporter family protein [Acidaminobacter sp. JC074]
MSTLDIGGLILVFVAILYIGVKSTSKVKNSDDYLLAGKSLNKVQAGFSLAATDLGGSGLIGASAYCYTVGISGSWWNLCAVPAFILLGIFLIRRLRPLAIATGPEFLEKRYDKKSRIIASVMQICAIVAGLSAQFLVGAVALNVLMDVPMQVGLIISVAVVILYTMGGGLIAVVNTDIFQFIILVGSVIVAVPLALVKAGGLDTVVASLPAEYFSMGELGFWTPVSWICLCLFLYTTQQTYLQRVFAAKDTSTAVFAYVFTGVIYIFYGLAVGFIGVIMASMMPGIVDANTVYAVMIESVMPPGLAGVVLGGVFAASMSTADSYLMAGTSLFINDIYTPLFGKDKEDKQMLLHSRILTVVICLGSLILANFVQNLIDMVYLAGLFYSTSVFFPIILGVFWKRTNATGAFSGIIASLIVGFSVEYIFADVTTGILSLPSNILSALSGLIVMVLVSLMTKKPAEEKVKFLEAS